MIINIFYCIIVTTHGKFVVSWARKSQRSPKSTMFYLKLTNEVIKPHINCKRNQEMICKQKGEKWEMARDQPPAMITVTSSLLTWPILWGKETRHRNKHHFWQKINWINEILVIPMIQMRIIPQKIWEAKLESNNCFEFIFLTNTNWPIRIKAMLLFFGK